MAPQEPRSNDPFIEVLSGDRVFSAWDSTALTAAEQAELAELQALLADPTLWAEPPADLEHRVVAAVVAAAPAMTGNNVASAADTTADTTAPQDDLSERRRARQDARTDVQTRQSWWRRPGPLAALAAAVATIALTSVLILRTVTPQPTFTAAMVATDLAPGANGSVTMTRTDSGWDIHLSATGLPRLDGGRFYQAWLRNPDGLLVSIGSFNEGTDVTLWAGVSPVDFPTITVTQEAADGDQGSSGKRVLVGTAIPR